MLHEPLVETDHILEAKTVVTTLSFLKTTPSSASSTTLQTLSMSPLVVGTVSACFAKMAPFLLKCPFGRGNRFTMETCRPLLSLLASARGWKAVWTARAVLAAPLIRAFIGDDGLKCPPPRRGLWRRCGVTAKSRATLKLKSSDCEEEEGLVGGGGGEEGRGCRE